eukprot:g16260.t1
MACALQAAACQRRSLCHRTALAFCETSRMRLKRAFWRAWCSAWEQVQQQRRSQQVLLRAMTSWDRQAPEVLRRSSFLAWRLQTFSPTKAFAWQTIEKARQRAATAPEKELLRSYWHLWTARMQEAALQQNADLRETALQQQLERCQHDASAARVAHEETVLWFSGEKSLLQVLSQEVERKQLFELLAQHVAEAREEAKALQLTFQERPGEVEEVDREVLRAVGVRSETKLQAEEAASQRLADEKLESAKLESRLTAAAEREKELRAEVARLADLLTAAEYDSLQKATRGKSLPAMSPLGSSTLDEVTKRWRLEHSHSVSAIYKSGSLPECLPVSGKLRLFFEKLRIHPTMALNAEYRGLVAHSSPHAVTRARPWPSEAKAPVHAKRGLAWAGFQDIWAPVVVAAREARGACTPGQPLPTSLPLAETDPWRLAVPALIASLVSLAIYPSVSLAVASLLDEVALGVIKGDA